MNFSFFVVTLTKACLVAITLDGTIVRRRTTRASHFNGAGNRTLGFSIDELVARLVFVMGLVRPGSVISCSFARSTEVAVVRYVDSCRNLGVMFVITRYAGDIITCSSRLHYAFHAIKTHQHRS